MSHRLLWLLVLVSLLSSLGSAHAQTPPCSGSLPSRLTVGATARITPGAGNNVRAEPAEDAALVGVVPAGTTFTVLEGPVCAGDYAWWRIEADAITGWTVEAVGDDYALEPAAASTGDSTTVSAEGVTFEMPSEITTDPVLSELVPYTTTDNEQAPIPGSSLRFLVNAAAIEFPQSHSYIQIYPLAAYSRIAPGFAEQMVVLREVLEQQPTPGLEVADAVAMTRGAAQVYAGQMRYLETERFVGVRYLAGFMQMTYPVLRDNTFYLFHGIVRDADGQNTYYVQIQLPVTVDFLPTEADDALLGRLYDETGEAYRAYQTELIAQMDDAAPEAFTPSLRAFDALVESIEVAPGTLADFGEMVDTLDLTRRDITQVEYGVCPNEDFPARLEVGSGARQLLPANHSAGLDDMPGGEGVGDFIDSSAMVYVLDGPVCHEGSNYWLVYEASGRVAGWTQEMGVYYEDNQMRYYYAPMTVNDAELAPPAIPSEQATTDCAIVPLRYAAVYATPNTNTRPVARLVNGMTYYADALLDRPEGGYRYWRLVPGAYGNPTDDVTINPLPEEAVWVLAYGVNESDGCADVPVIAAP
ncbi:MAG: SH3 domain-containing protein [bacterium]|nr:SH3 domain-containing protein [bacterium]